MPRDARDLGFVDAVGVELGGRFDSFDGNHTNHVVAWLVLPPGKALGEGDVEVLLEWLEQGHLAWFVIPTNLD